MFIRSYPIPLCSQLVLTISAMKPVSRAKSRCRLNLAIVLICISSSGNSANILAALRKASSMGLKTIALTGFSGGESAKLADINLHVAAHNYGIVEDCHQILMHNIAQYIYGRRKGRLTCRW